MKWAAAVALFLACAPAGAQPAQQPHGWPSDVCHATGANIGNPMCGTCSSSVVYSTPEFGTYVGWVCKWPDGEWRTQEITRPWMSRWNLPGATGLAAMWQANAIPPTDAEAAKYAQLVALARPYLAHVWRPPEQPASAWIVSPVSTRLRPSYLVDAGNVTRESGQFIPTGTPAAPTACACDSAGDAVDFGVSKLCRVPNFLTTSGQARYASCVRRP